ncbi:MAG: HIT domain-containing protein [Candidatus Aenigmarchaeota archaeon]|nr:HIT domain-containing protein [Candidatus Aenigmarchaeota archaeon]
MERLWAPWRLEYLRRAFKKQKCIFCYLAKEKKDEKNHILYRAEKVFVMLNKYPYSPGHLMVSPYRHVDRIARMTEEERHEMTDVAAKFSVMLETALKAEGFNMGINQGRLAGAGFDKHVHMHVVPRWKHDVNFMVPVAGTKVIPETLEQTYAKIKAAMNQASLK